MPRPSRIDPQQFLNSRLAVSLAYGLARTVPRRLSKPLVSAIAGWISRRKSWDIVQAVRLNQWVVSEGTLTSTELDQAAAATFAHSGHCIYDLYHNAGQITASSSLVEATPPAWQLLQKISESREGMVVVAPHTSNFDLVGRWLAAQGLTALLIGFPQPGSGYRWQNTMRRNAGFELLPASRQAIRRALDHLQSGGTVITGLERPVPGSRYQPCFFGRPAPLPVFHISLAIQAHVPLVLANVEQQTDGHYQFWASEPITMQPGANRHAEILSNAETVLSMCEERIRRAPQQWLMFYPVWPEALAEVPR